MKKLLLSILVCSYISADSQVYTAGTVFSSYTDIMPDTLLKYDVFPYTNNIFDLNLFDDPSPDLQFNAHGAVSSGGSAAYIRIASLNHNVSVGFGRWDSVFVIGDGNWNVTKVAQPLNTGDTLNDPNAVWDTTTLYLTDHSGHSGGNKNVNDWIGGDKFVALKYNNGNITLYGWIRLQCVTEDSCYIKDYSITPQVTAIEKTNSPQVKIFPNPFHTAFFVEDVNSGRSGISDLKLTDLYGKEIKFTAEVQSSVLKIDPGCDLPQGCYLLRYLSGEQVFLKKLIKTTE